VANSALMIATRFGMDVTLLCPTQYVLDSRYAWFGRDNAAANGGLAVSHDIASSCAGADVVYAKAGGLAYFGNWDQENRFASSSSTSSSTKPRWH
jgi:N-acetylornithine carbamoyltransferase